MKLSESVNVAIEALHVVGVPLFRKPIVRFSRDFRLLLALHQMGQWHRLLLSLTTRLFLVLLSPP